MLPRTLAPSPSSLQVAPRLYAGHWTFANVQTAIATVRKPGNLHNPSTPNPGGHIAARHPPHRNTIPPMQSPSRLPRHRPSVSMRAGQPEARSGRSISEHGSCNVRKVSLLRATADTIFGEFDPLCREERGHCAGRTRCLKPGESTRSERGFFGRNPRIIELVKRTISILALAVTMARGQSTGKAEAVTIDAAIQEAVEHNLDLAAERMNISVAEARIITARLRPNPVLTVSGQSLDLLGATYSPNTPLRTESAQRSYRYSVRARP